MIIMYPHLLRSWLWTRGMHDISSIIWPVYLFDSCGDDGLVGGLFCLHLATAGRLTGFVCMRCNRVTVSTTFMGDVVTGMTWSVLALSSLLHLKTHTGHVIHVMV